MMTVLTVSRQLGSQGSYIAVDVARTLGLKYIDREIIDRAAREAGVSETALASMEEQRGLVRRVLDAMGRMPSIPSDPSASRREAALRKIDPSDPRIKTLMDQEGLTRVEALTRVQSMDFGGLGPESVDYRDLIGSIVIEYARAGNAVIVGRGGQVILKDLPNVLHVQIIAPLARRVEAIMEREKLERNAAEKRIKESDEARASYVHRYYKANWLDPNLYDLVINTNKITQVQAVELIVSAGKGLP
jgi:cytidylate kinase